jgi:hypothetical protein
MEYPPGKISGNITILLYKMITHGQNAAGQKHRF